MRTGEKTEMVKKKAVSVYDAQGFPNFMTMFYLEPGKYATKDIPDMFRVAGHIVPAVLISQYTNSEIKGVPVSMPCREPIDKKSHNEAAKMCRDKGLGWHLMTNAEWVYLLNEADQLGHKITGNTQFGKSADNPEEKGISFDAFGTLTGLEPLAWSHDGTKGGVFGLCGNFWEHVAGVRTHNGVIEYIKDNDAAAKDYGPQDAAWKAAEVNGRKLSFDRQCGYAVLTDRKIMGGLCGAHMQDLRLSGDLAEVPEIIYRLGLLPRDYKSRKDELYINSRALEAVMCRGSNYAGEAAAGPAALELHKDRNDKEFGISFRSSLYLTDQKIVQELLKQA